MAGAMISLVVQTDEESAAALSKALRPLPETRVQEQRVHALTGDPNTWVLVAQAAAAAIGAVAPILITLIQKNKIGKVVIDGQSFENVKAADAERVLKALGKYKTAK
jgi:hypothetical protein